MAKPLHKIQQRVFKVFYRDELNGQAVASTNPQSMLLMNIPELAERILQHADSFIGIIDTNDTILQLYLDGEDQVMLEMIFPNAVEGHVEPYAYQDALRKINGLPAQFSLAWLLQG